MSFDNPHINAKMEWWTDLGIAAGDLTSLDLACYQAARERQSALTKPEGSLGRLEDLACWLAGWQKRELPRLHAVEMVVFAGNHGVTVQGVSPFPQSVTVQMVENFRGGGAAICQLCEAYGANLSVVSLDLESPTADITLEPAMSVADCRSALEQGAEAVNVDADILLLGEMGIGNTTVAAALCHALLGGAASDWAGPGTGLGPDGVARKAEIIKVAVDCHAPHVNHPFEALRRVGGRELAAITGAILQARRRRIPVLLDGYVCTAAAMAVEKAFPGGLDHCLAGHVSAEPAHRRLLQNLGMEPLVDLGMRLGEGTGAAVALGILRGAVATHNGMATFAAAKVDNRD